MAETVLQCALLHVNRYLFSFFLPPTLISQFLCLHLTGKLQLQYCNFFFFTKVQGIKNLCGLHRKSNIFTFKIQLRKIRRKESVVDRYFPP